MSATFTLPDELAALADNDQQALGFLALAQEWCDADDAERVRISGRALRGQVGTVGERLVAWEDLREAVETWHAWDRVADSQGRTDQLDIPSRERVQFDVEIALRLICERSVAA